MGYLLSCTNRAERSIEEFERALAPDPNLAKARAGLGFAHVVIGRAEETEAHVLEALRLSPGDGFVSAWLLHVGTAKAFLGDFEAAAVWFRKSIDANRSNPWAIFQLAACLAQLGRLDEALDEMKSGLAVFPKFTIARYRAGLPSSNAVCLAQRERVIEGLRLAGAPEG
jgi:tetratricopeptide (TPR) repeat protein